MNNSNNNDNNSLYVCFLSLILCDEQNYLHTIGYKLKLPGKHKAESNMLYSLYFMKANIILYKICQRNSSLTEYAFFMMNRAVSITSLPLTTSAFSTVPYLVLL